MSLTSCLKEATALSPNLRNAVMKRAGELRKDGKSGPEAALQAATEIRDRVAAELAAAEEADQLLQAQTEEDLRAKTDREQVALDGERRQREAEQARLRKEAEDRDIRARADATVDDFQLGQSAQQQMSGMSDLFSGDPGTMFDGQATEADTPAEPPAPSLRERAGAMKDAAAKRKALDDLNDALGDLGDILGKNVRKNLTPEQEQKLLPVLTRVMDAAFRAGYYSFRQAARFVLDKIRGALGDDAADAITLDHLQGAYIGMAGRYRDDPAFADRRPDAKRAVVEIESKEELENGDAPTTGDDVERGGQPGLAAGDQDVRGPVPAAAGEAGRGAGQPGAAPGTQRAGSGRGARVADGDAAADGERGDQPRRGGRAAGAPGPAGDRERERSTRAGDPRVQSAAAPGEEAAAADSHAAAVARRVAAQKLAGAKPVTFADKASIDETLPLLLPEQRDDVLKAETRFAAGHAGILFTNGTGTGKTFTGLGIVKRMHQAGKRNILILAPSDKIINDWVRSAKMLGLDIGQLESTKDAGKGIVITTYANAGANLTLADRDWDGVVADESHYLSSNKDGDLTAAAATLRAITLHPDGAYTRAAMIHRELDAKITQLNEAAKSNRTSDDERLWAKAAQQEAEASRLMREFEAKRDAIKADIKARQATRTKVVFLSATPFAWVQNLNYAQGYLFDWHEGKGQDLASGSGWGHSYNSGDHREQFYMQHFGYRMRYNKLTRPEAGVDVALMERQFNTYLKRTGALTGRQLEVGPDYDRRFIAVESGLGRRIDEALGYERDDGFDYTTATKEQTDARNADQELRTRLNKAFAFQQRQYFLEAIKARALVPYIQAQLDAGRKVVVFHDFKKGGVRENPFSARVVLDGVAKDGPQAAAYERWAARFPDLANLDVAGLGSPIETLGAAFEGRIDLFNGDIKAKDGEANVARFNDDASGPRVLLVQSAKAEGWSGHDTTGKHQRVQLNLGMPTRPFTAIQQEGRIYRTGQASDAMQRYASTGTSWERAAFAQKLAERAETTENLAMGEAARALKQSFIDAYENADDYPPGHEGEGKGGKEADRASNNVVSAFDLAKTAYWAQQKRTQRNKSREGTDYFATPEPIGLKLVEWLDLRAGETGMEPSAGHGAIARWFPEHIPTVAVEPSDELRSRLALVFNGNHARLRDGTFEQLDVGANKADGIAMNPPFGVGGSMAIPHLAKAVKHLRDGGRVAAIVPRGGMADKRLDAFLESEEGQGLRWVADITLPGITFNRAGAGVVARVVVFDKGVDPEGQAVTRDLRSIEDINELFDRLENVELPRRGKPVPTAEELIAATRTADAPPTREERQAIREVQKAEKEQRKGSGASLAEQLGLQLVDYTTSKGKLIKGVLRSDLTRDQVQQFSSAPFWMRDRRAWFIRDHELAKAHELFPFQGVAREPAAGYSAPYETDLFGNPVPAPNRENRRAPPGRAAADGDVGTPADVPPGRYATRTALVATRQQRLGARTVRSVGDSANALAYLRQSAVERLDAVVTDDKGKPLAVIGGFKGALAQTSVYPSTLLGEAIQVPGARRVWLVHNHPSGTPDLSRADEGLAQQVSEVFSGTRIEVGGMVAVAAGRWSGGNASDRFAGKESGELSPMDGAVVPAQERQITQDGKLGRPITSPSDAKAVVREIVQGNMGRPTIVLLDSQHAPVAAVPWDAADAMPLRDNGKIDALLRAVAMSNAGAALIGTGGPLTTTGDGMTLAQAQNLGAGLAKMDVRVLDIIGRDGATAAERGEGMRGHVLLRLADDIDQADGSPDTAAYGRASPDDAAALRRAQRSINRARPDLVLDAVPARAGAAAGQPLRGADRARVAAAELARRLFGKRVVFFTSNTPFANGFYASGDDTRIFLNADSRAPHMAVLGHELLHAMRKDRPDLYDALKARVMAVARDTDQRDLLPQLQRLKAGLPKIEQDVLDEEFIADVVGDRFMEPEFWRAMAKDQPGAFQRVVQAVRRFLDDVLQALTQRRPFNTAAYLADVQVARDAVADALRNYSGGEVESMAAEPDQEIRFSLDDGSPQRQALGDFLAAVRTGSKSRFNALHRTISTQLHKATVDADFARVFGIAQDYEQDVARAASRPAQQAPDLLPAFDNARAALRRLLRGDREKALNDKVAKALFAGTLENGPEPHTGVIWSDAALRDRFGLDDRGISLYRQARKAIDASLDETASALAYQMVKKHAPQLRQAVRRVPGRARALIEASLGPLAADPEIGAALDDALAVFDRAAELKAGGYAPLMRFGRYAVDVVGEDGERLHFERFDTELQAKIAAQRLAREYPGASVERSTMSEEAYKLFAGVDPETVALFSQQLGNRIDGTALQEWYRKAVSDRSAMKRMIGPRKGMAGYSPDLQRVLASFITSNARLSARQMNMGDMASTIADMQERRVAGDVVDEAMRLRDYLDNPDEPFKGLRSLMFTWYLGGSVASAAVNMTQPVMMTLPYLSQFGNASKYLSGAVKEAMSGKVANEKLRNAMQRAAEDGKVDPQEVHHLYHEGMSTLVDRLPGGNDLKARAQGFATLWGWFFGAAENFNRRITFIAAYRMAQADETLGDPYAFAIRAIDETQGIYNKSNRPNWARGTGSFGALGVAAFTFKQYSIAYVELLVRMAKSGPQGKRAALAMLGMLVLVSGLQGLPGMEDLQDLIDTAAQMMGLRGNSQATVREALVDAFGSSVADAIMYGPASGLPFDITSRLGMGDLLPATGVLKPSNERRRGQELAEILGPMGGFASQIGDFTTALDAGAGPGKAIAAFSPLAVKNALMGLHMLDDGYYRDTGGRRVTDTSDADAAFKFIGFQPQSVASVRRPERLVAQDISRVKGVESDIVRLRAEAIVERDQDKRQRARDMLADWNRSNPELRIVIKDSQVMRMVQQMRRTSGERILSTAPRETRRALAETL